MPPDRYLVLGPIPHGLVVAPRPEAERLAALHRALSASSTWGEFLGALSAANRRAFERHLAPYVEDDDFDLPPDGAAFAPEQIPGFSDGDWPAWPPRQALAWVPDDVRALGRVEQTVHNGPYLVFDPDAADLVTAALQAAGYEVERDDALVDAACGIYPSGSRRSHASSGRSGRAYLFDLQEGRAIAAEEDGTEAPLGLDRLDALLTHLAAEGHHALLRRFAVWTAATVPEAKGAGPLLEAARADATAWEATTAADPPDVSALKAARDRVAGAAMAASAVGLRHGAANAAAFLAAYEAAQPDPRAAAGGAARMVRLHAELAADGAAPVAVTQQQLDWLLDHLP